VPIDVTPSRHCQTPPSSSSHHVEASRANPSLEGRAPAPVATAEAVLRAGALLGAAHAAVVEHPSRLRIVGLPSTVFAAASE
jgi:hypothetical protein